MRPAKRDPDTAAVRDRPAGLNGGRVEHVIDEPLHAIDRAKHDIELLGRIRI
jgi:hypothetical protein